MLRGVGLGVRGGLVLTDTRRDYTPRFFHDSEPHGRLTGMSTDFKKLVLLVDGYCEPLRAKTAVCLLRYRTDDVVAMVDRENAGKTSQEVLGFGGDTPVVATLADAPPADALVIGIATPGGYVPAEWRPILLEAIDRGMGIASGLHDFLSNDAEFREAAQSKGVTLWDVRRNDEHEVAKATGFREDCLRVLTVGHDCSVGKMVAAAEITRGLKERDVAAKFVATGQTGILVEGDGCPIDCVVSDFLSGAVEKQIHANQDDHRVLVIEGQATISHPRYSGVSTGLLHGSRPQGMVMVYEPTREHVHGMPDLPLVPLPKLIRAYEDLAGLVSPAKVIAVAINGRRLDAERAREETRKVSEELGLPAADPVRDGPEALCEAILSRRDELLCLGAGE